jgi:pectate lyase
MWREALVAVAAAALLAPALGAGQDGFGAATKGGEGGVRVSVTTLADSGPGSLREALAGPGPRRIVFTLGGTIRAHKRLVVQSQTGVTIDGASAPPPGITLEGAGLALVDAQDVIVRHLRVRSARTDGIAVTRSHRVVIDHCSVSDARDENVSVTDSSRAVTVAWSLLGDTRTDQGTVRAKGMLIATYQGRSATEVSVHHNLFVNLAQRSPQVSTDGVVDIRNNVIRDWVAYGARFRAGARGNVVNNSFASHRQPDRALVLKPDAGPVYVAGNQGAGAVTGTAQAAWPVAAAAAEPAAAAVPRVLAGAGAWPRDEIDARLVARTQEAHR